MKSSPKAASRRLSRNAGRIISLSFLLFGFCFWSRGAPSGSRLRTANDIALAELMGEGKVTASVTSTGKTIGDVATLSLHNLTDSPINARVPPMVLISASGAYQSYAVPFGQTVTVPEQGTINTSLDGICLNARKPPVGAGVTGELAVVDGGGNQLIAPAAGPMTISYPVSLANEMISGTRIDNGIGQVNALATRGAAPPKLADGERMDALTDQLVANAMLGNGPQTVATGQQLRTAVNEIFETATVAGPKTKDEALQNTNSVLDTIDTVVANATSTGRFPVGPPKGGTGTTPTQPSPGTPNTTGQTDSAEVKAAKKKLDDALDDLHKASERAVDTYNGGNNVGGPSNGSDPDKGPDSKAYKRALDDLHAAEDKVKEAQGAVLVASDPNNPNIGAVTDAQEAVKTAQRNLHYANRSEEVKKATAALSAARANLRAALRKFAEGATTPAPNTTTTSPAPPITTTTTPSPTPQENVPPTVPSSLTPAAVSDVLAGTAEIFRVSQKLQATHQFKTPFASNPQKELDTVRQWTTWRWQSIEEGKPITKTDMANKVYEQVGGISKLTESQKIELKKGVDNIWSAVELTGEEAKITPTRPTTSQAPNGNVVYQTYWDPNPPVDRPVPGPSPDDARNPLPPFTPATENNPIFTYHHHCDSRQTFVYKLEGADRALLQIKNTGQCDLEVAFSNPASRVGRGTQAPFETGSIPARSDTVFPLLIPADLRDGSLQITVTCTGRDRSRCDFEGSFALGGETVTTSRKKENTAVPLLPSDQVNPPHFDFNNPSLKSKCITTAVVLKAVQNVNRKPPPAGKGKPEVKAEATIGWSAVNTGTCNFYATASTDRSGHYDSAHHPPAPPENGGEKVPDFSLAKPGEKGNAAKATIPPRANPSAPIPTVYIIGQCWDNDRDDASCRGRIE